MFHHIKTKCFSRSEVLTIMEGPCLPAVKVDKLYNFGGHVVLPHRIKYRPLCYIMADLYDISEYDR